MTVEGIAYVVALAFFALVPIVGAWAMFDSWRTRR